MKITGQILMQFYMLRYLSCSISWIQVDVCDLDLWPWELKLTAMFTFIVLILDTF